MKHASPSTTAFTALALLMLTGTAASQGLSVTRSGAPNAPFASAIWAGDTLYLAGALPDAVVPPGSPPGTRGTITGDTEAQTASTLARIQRTLREQGLDLGDVVQMRVYLVADPAKGDKMDFAGMNTAYGRFFGTPTQPLKPTRTTVQVAGLAIAGALVEIEVTAVRPARQP